MESFRIQVVTNPLPGVKGTGDVGSDNGERFTAFTICPSRWGVSPWYWLADVPVETETRFM